MSPVSPVFHTVEKVRFAIIKKLNLCVLSFDLGTKSRETGELLPDRNAEPYPYKWRAEIGILGSCSQLFCYINYPLTPRVTKWMSFLNAPLL